MTRTKSLLATVAAGLAGFAGGWWLLRRSVPKSDGNLTLQGLLDDVEIMRDQWGVPHIYAETASDLFFAQGFAHAQDRLWQMDFQRRLASGRLCEIFGGTTLDVDRWARVLGFRRQGEIDVQHLSDEARRALEAYAKGVNQFIETTPALPVEFSLLHYDPEAWTPVDSLSWAKLIAFVLSSNWDGEIIRARLIDRLGDERASLLSGKDLPAGPAAVPGVDYASLGASALERKAAADSFFGVEGASNSWVIAGARSTTNKPLLANDPHLLMRIPGIWCENHLSGGGYNVIGASLPGVPAVLIGHNERIAWGITAGMADVQDLYVERFNPDDSRRYEVNGRWQAAEIRFEEINVRGRRKPDIQEVVITRHGPVITELIPGETQQLALRWTGYDADTGGVQCFLELNRATGWKDVRRALADHGVPVLNITYADVDGNIGYQFAGKIPVRRNGDGRVPVSGWTDDYAWDGYLSLDDLPTSLNPECGFIVTANNKPAGEEYPHYLGDSFRPGFRAQRITELIEARERHDRASLEAMQADQLSIPMRRLAKHLARLDLDDPQLEAAQADVAYWDGRMDKNAIGATLAQTTLFHFRRVLFGEKLGPLADVYLGQGFHPLLHPISGTAAKNIEIALDVLAEPDSALLDGRPLDDVLADSFRATVDELKRELGPNMNRWQWGRVNELSLEHPLGVVPLLQPALNRGPYPAGGDPFTVWPSAARFHPSCKEYHSASYRLIVDLDDLSRSVSVCPPGQSGHPGSPHYADQMSLWLDGQCHPLLWERDAVELACEGILKLQPAPRKVQLGLEEDTEESEVTVLRALAEAGDRLRKQILGRDGEMRQLPPELDYEEPDPEYAYTVFWVKTTREWDKARRRTIADALAEVLNRPDFEPNPTQRRYTVAGLEGQYSGLSLKALAGVLRAWDDAPES